MTGHEIAEVLRRLDSFAKGRQREIVALAVPLLRGRENGWERCRMLQAVSALPGTIEEQRAIIALAQFVQFDPGLGLFAHTLRAVGELPGTLENKRTIIALAKPLLDKAINGADKAWILETVGTLSGGDVDGMRATIALAEPLVMRTLYSSDTVDYSLDAVDLLRVVDALPKDGRSDIIALARRLITGTRDYDGKINVRGAVLAVSRLFGDRKEREATVAIAEPFLRGMPDSWIVDLLPIIDALPGTTANKEAITALTKSFLSEDEMDVSGVRELLVTIASVPGTPDERRRTIELARAWLCDRGSHSVVLAPDAHWKAWMLRTLNTMRDTAQGQQRILQCARPLLDVVDGGDRGMDVLFLVRRLPPEADWQQIVPLAQPLIPPGSSMALATQALRVAFLLQGGRGRARTLIADIQRALTPLRESEQMIFLTTIFLELEAIPTVEARLAWLSESLDSM